MSKLATHLAPDGMLESLITSKTRIKLLLKFFLNSNNSAHLRGLESEFNESTNGIRLELNRFEKAGLLSSHIEGNRKLYQANTNHPLFIDIQHLVFKHIGLDQLIEKVLMRLGEIDRVYLTGAFAKGQNSQVIELLIFSDNINIEYLDQLIGKASSLIKRQIKYLIVDKESAAKTPELKECDSQLLLWQQH